MDLLNLRYFQRVAEYQNITRAAESLSVAQPAVSKMIKQLENELNGPLFDRVGRNIQLNERGKLLLAYTTDILQNVDRIYESLQTGSHLCERISFCVAVGSSLIPRILSEFRQLHPSYQIAITTDSRQTLVDLELFQSLHEIWEDNACTILKEEIALAVPKDHPLAQYDSIDLQEIRHHSLIGLRQERSYMQLMEPFFKLAGVTPNMSLELDNPETLRKLINAGYGVSFVPKLTWTDAKAENIRFVHIRYPSCYRYINIRWKKGYLSKAALELKNYLIELFTNGLEQ